MKRLSETCRKLGYVFAIHDQYRDFYYTGKKFDIQKAVTKIDGTHFIAIIGMAALIPGFVLRRPQSL